MAKNWYTLFCNKIWLLKFDFLFFEDVEICSLHTTYIVANPGVNNTTHIQLTFKLFPVSLINNENIQISKKAQLNRLL